jgi:hypothetical protein
MPLSSTWVEEPEPRELSALATPSICSERAKPSVSPVLSSPLEMSGTSDPPPI